MARRRKDPTEAPADTAPVPDPPAQEPPAEVEQVNEQVDPTAADEAPPEQSFGLTDNDQPLANAEPGRAIPDSQIPYPDWMIALDEPDAEYDLAFRLRGRHDDQAIHRAVASLDTATTLVRQYQQLGWGGDVTVTRLSDSAVIAVEAAPLTDPNAPI